MITQQKQLVDRLIENGWEITDKDENPSEWWADEKWVVKSVWSPKDLKIYLTFLVDPQWEGNRKKGEQILPLPFMYLIHKEGCSFSSLFFTLIFYYRPLFLVLH